MIAAPGTCGPQQPAIPLADERNAMRVALHSVLREGHESDYERDHAAIPDDLTASFERVGIHDWTIWRSGRDLFHLVDCDDFDAAMGALDADPANERWQRFIGPHIAQLVTDPDRPGAVGLAQVWSLKIQTSSAQDQVER